MTYSVEFTSDAIVELETLTKTIQERILRKVRWLSDNFENVNHQALSANLSGFFKLRVDDYRVIYSFIDVFKPKNKLKINSFLEIIMRQKAKFSLNPIIATD